MYLEYGGNLIVFYLLILPSNSMELRLSSNFQIVKNSLQLIRLRKHYYKLCMFHIHTLRNIYTYVIKSKLYRAFHNVLRDVKYNK
jgi:hypothetical protein